MWDESDPGSVAYRWVLRGVGAYLDSQQASGVSVIEAADGFALRYIPSAGDVALNDHISFEDLTRQEKALRKGRRGWRPRLGRGSPENLSYADAFRVLGYELERLEAYAVLLDQVEDGFLLTYLRLDPSTNYRPRKEMRQIGSAAIRDALQKGRNRRGAAARTPGR